MHMLFFALNVGREGNFCPANARHMRFEILEASKRCMPLFEKEKGDF